MSTSDCHEILDEIITRQKEILHERLDEIIDVGVLPTHYNENPLLLAQLILFGISGDPMNSFVRMYKDDINSIREYFWKKFGTV